MDYNENLFGTPEHGPITLPQGQGGGGIDIMGLLRALGQRMPPMFSPPGAPGSLGVSLPGLGMPEQGQVPRPQPVAPAPQAAVPTVAPPTPQPIPTRPAAIPAPSANGAGAPYGSAAAAPSTTSPASPDMSTEMLGDVPGGTATQLQGDAQDPMMGAVKALQGVKPPPAPEALKPSTPGAPQAKPMESGLMDILMMNQKLRDARTVLPMFSQMIGR